MKNYPLQYAQWKSNFYIKPVLDPWQLTDILVLLTL